MDYTQLKADIADWLMRDDLEAQIPSFIRLAEAGFNAAIRSEQMGVRAESTLDGPRLALPVDFLEMRTLVLPDVRDGLKMEPATPDQLFAYRRLAGAPRYFAVVGRQLLVAPAPRDPESVEMDYFQRIEALSDDEPVNWLLNLFPNVYLYGALMQSAPYLKEDERTGTWKTLLDEGIADVHRSSERSRHTQGALSVRARSL